MNTMASLSPSGKPQSQTQVTSSQLKRTTCNLCRERKVRCDREKPQCHRCRKSGQTCVYPSDKTDNDEIKSALNLLHSRLRKYAPDAASPVNFFALVVLLSFGFVLITVVQAETRLQEQGLQFTTQSMKPNSTLSPSYISQNSQFAYDLLSQGDDMDYSSVAFSEFDPRYALL
jgi:hypothetical protein